MDAGTWKVWEAWRDLRVLNAQINFALDDVHLSHPYQAYIDWSHERINEEIPSTYEEWSAITPDRLIERYTDDGFIINSELFEDEGAAYNEFQRFDKSVGSSRNAWINDLSSFVQQMNDQFLATEHSANWYADLEYTQQQAKWKRVAIEAILLRKQIKETKDAEPSRAIGQLPLFRKEKWVRWRNEQGQMVGEPTRDWKIREGEILAFHEQHFISTTGKDNWLEDQRPLFRSTATEKWVVLIIHSRKKGANITHQSVKQKIEREEEVLFPIGTRFKVRKIQFDARKDREDSIRGQGVYLILEVVEL